MTIPTRPVPSGKPKTGDGPLSRSARKHMAHFNGGTLVRAADAWRDVIDRGDGMFISLAGAFSTGRGGVMLSELIRRKKIHAISCTGANLEEDVFLLKAANEYRHIPDYKDKTPAMDQALAKKSLPRVTDVAIPEKLAMKPVIEALTVEWKKADDAGTAKFPHEFLWDVLRSGAAKPYQGDPRDSWVLTAMEHNVPIWTPGYEDSSSGNAFASACMRGEIQNVTTMRSGMEAMISLCGFYTEFTKNGRQLGWLELGGGIAADFAICAVPLLHLELDRADLPLWCCFCGITDSTESYGSYSGAGAAEKGSWTKRDADSPNFKINSDYSIVFPRMAEMVLGL